MKRTPLAERVLPDYTRGEEICNMVTHILGGALGILGMRLMPDFPAADLLSAAAVGIVSGLAATGADQIGKQLEK